MKVLHVCADRGIPVGGTKGASIHLRAIAEALEAVGHEVVMAAARVGGDLDEFPVPVVKLREERGLQRAARCMGRPDVVLERYSLGHEAGLAFARSIDVPFVLEVNAPLVDEARRHRPDTVGPADAVIEHRLFRDADLVVTVSHPLRDLVARSRGTADGVIVIPNGVDPGRFRGEVRRSLSTVRMVFVGHPKPWHGAERLPGVLAALVDGGDDVVLDIIGGGSGAEAVLQRARALGVSDRVRVTGPVPESVVTQELLGADVLVAPYPRQDPFYFCPLKVIEAMAAAVPVVSTEQGDLARIVADGGVLVPPDDDEAMTSAIRSLVRDPELRRSIGAAGRARVQEEYTWEAAARRLTEAVAPICAGSAP